MTTCIADGAELVEFEPDPSPSGTHRVLEPIVETAPPAPPPSNNRLPQVLLVFLLGLIIVGVGAYFLGRTTVDAPTTVVVPVAAPTPAPAPTPPPAPVPAIVEAAEFSLVTVPEGATVEENGSRLCSTPCAVPHPEHAPLPRVLDITLQGYRPEKLSVDSGTGQYYLRLQPIQAAPSPRVATPTPPRPAPQPRPAPSPVPSSGPVPRPDPAPVVRPGPVPVAPAPAPAPAPDIETLEELKDPFG